MRKGQMSLETIISFIIVLVVIGIIIGILLSQTELVEIENEDARFIQDSFENKCKELCRDAESNDYCRYYYIAKDPGSDWNANGINSELVSVEGSTIKWDVCEDRVYCFHTSPCKRFGENPLEGCVKELCEEYTAKYSYNSSQASEAVLDKIRPGSCKLPENLLENWYLVNFPNDVCK